MINMCAILLNFMPVPLVSYLAAMILVLITYSTLSIHELFAMVSDERSNMLQRPMKKLSKMGSTVNGATL